MRTSWLNSRASPLHRLIWSFAAVNFSVCLCFCLKPCWVLHLAKNVQNQGQLTMQTKLWVSSYFYVNCSAQPSGLDHPGAQSTLRSPQSLAVPCSTITPCRCTQMRADLVSFLFPAAQYRWLSLWSSDQTAACSKRSSCQQPWECPFKWLLLHANITSSTQVCMGLLGTDVLVKGNIQHKIRRKGRVWVYIKRHKYWYLCTPIISQNWIFPLRASMHFIDVFVSPDAIDLNYKTSIFIHSIHFHTEWKQMKLSFFFYFLHSMLWWNEIKYDTLLRQTLSPFKTRGLFQVSVLIVWVCSKPF